MASLLADRKGYLFVDFYFRGHRCREYQALRDTRDNRREKKNFVRDLQAALRQPNFDYCKWFPDSPRAAKFSPAKNPSTVSAYYTRWLGTLEVSAATRYDYECLARAYLDRTPLGAMEIASVTVTDIREVVKNGRCGGV